MITWNPSQIEAFFGSRFEIPDQEDPFQFHEALFEAGGLRYLLMICPVSENVHLRADTTNPNQATPQFEFSFRCDRIRIDAGGYKSNAVFFEFSNGDQKVDFQNHCRLVMDRLPNGNLYIWPVIGASDQPKLNLNHSIKK